MSEGPYEYGFAIGESWVHIKSDNRKAIKEAVESIKYNRRKIEEYIKKHPGFRYSLKPLKVEKSAPKIIKCMAEAAEAADVGPMAAVAGALADLALEKMIKCGVNLAIVENGGEIAVVTDRPVYVALVSLSPSFLGNVGFEIKGDDCPLGIATSTGKGSHALSFGEADSVTVTAGQSALADAAATAICNEVSGLDVDLSINKGLEKFRTIHNIKGVFIIRDGKVGLAGNLPRIIRISDEEFW